METLNGVLPMHSKLYVYHTCNVSPRLPLRREVLRARNIHDMPSPSSHSIGAIAAKVFIVERPGTSGRECIMVCLVTRSLASSNIIICEPQSSRWRKCLQQRFISVFGITLQSHSARTSRRGKK